MRRRIAQLLAIASCMVFGLGVSLKGGPQNPVKKTFTYTIYNANSTMPNDEYVCMPAVGPLLSYDGTTLIVESFVSAYFNSASNLCAASGELKDWDDGSGAKGASIRYMDNIKPAGVAWTAKQLSCMLYGSAPSGTTTDKDYTFLVAWRDSDEVVLEDGTAGDPGSTLTLPLSATIHTPVTEAINFPIGTKDAMSGMVVMVNDEDTFGGTLVKVSCTVSVEVL